MSRGKFGLIVVLTCAGVGATATTAAAAPLHCGQVLRHDTKLTADLTGCPGDGLVIGARRITINLNGHTVSGTGAGAGIADEAGHDRIKVRNGTVSGFAHGVSLTHVKRSTLTHLTVQGGAPAILLTSSDRNRLTHNTISGGVSVRVGNGIELTKGSDRNRLTHDVIDASERGLVVADSDRTAVTHSTVGGFAGNAVTNARRTRLARDTITAGRGTALELTNTTRSEITDNELSAGDTALTLTGSRDVLRGNTASGTPADGIVVNAAATHAQVIGNTANGNRDDGLEVDAPGTLVKRNTANDNGDLGIEAVDGVIDGGGNLASGNRNPLQCLNIACG